MLITNLLRRMQKEQPMPEQDAQQAKEIEVTPEMMSAGREALDQWLDGWGYFEGWPGDESESELIASIFRSMAAESPESLSKSTS